VAANAAAAAAAGGKGAKGKGGAKGSSRPTSAAAAAGKKPAGAKDGKKGRYEHRLLGKGVSVHDGYGHCSSSSSSSSIIGWNTGGHKAVQPAHISISNSCREEEC
jgi:hypothetical protein